MQIEQWVGLAAAKEFDNRGLHLMRVFSGMATHQTATAYTGRPHICPTGITTRAPFSLRGASISGPTWWNSSQSTYGARPLSSGPAQLARGYAALFPERTASPAQPIGHLFINDNHQVTGVGFSEGMFTIAACKGVMPDAPAAHKAVEQPPKQKPIKFLALEVDTGAMSSR
ncbi:hypothetical protein [Vibrio phage VP16T]|nr:hypothetical protein [Vibrio phage VP16T]